MSIDLSNLHPYSRQMRALRVLANFGFIGVTQKAAFLFEQKGSSYRRVPNFGRKSFEWLREAGLIQERDYRWLYRHEYGITEAGRAALAEAEHEA